MMDVALQVALALPTDVTDTFGHSDMRDRYVDATR